MSLTSAPDAPDPDLTWPSGCRCRRRRGRPRSGRTEPLVRLGVRSVVEDDPDRKPVPLHPVIGMGYNQDIEWLRSPARSTFQRAGRPPAQQPAGGAPTPGPGCTRRRRTLLPSARARPPARRPGPAAAPARRPDPASPQSTPARRTRTGTRRGPARQHGAAQYAPPTPPAHPLPGQPPADADKPCRHNPQPQACGQPAHPAQSRTSHPARQKTHPAQHGNRDQINPGARQARTLHHTPERHADPSGSPRTAASGQPGRTQEPGTPNSSGYAASLTCMRTGSVCGPQR